MSIRRNQTGFTLIELMIATIVFSVVLLLCTASLIYVGRLYYKGVTASKTQETARAIMDEVAQAIQFSGTDVTPESPLGTTYDVRAYCIGGRLYTYQVGKQVTTTGVLGANQARHAMVVNDNPGCTSAAVPQQMDPLSPADSKELVAERMRLTKLEITPVNPAAGLYRVTVKVVHGNDDLLDNVGSPDPGTINCKLGQGSQYCAVSELTTTVQKRVK